MERFSLCVCVFHRVVGPAVTFKVSPNTQNVTTADVANVAGRCFLGSLMLLLVALPQKKDGAIIGSSAAHLRPLAASGLLVCLSVFFVCVYVCVFILPHAH